MIALLSRYGNLDRLAIGLSGLCLVHCLATTVLLAVLASAGGILFDHRIHEAGLVLAILLGIFSLVRGYWRHGYMMPVAIGSLGLGMMAGALDIPHNEGEIFYTMLGVAVLALGHDLNYRATH